jgi:serine/threonine protein kinase
MTTTISEWTPLHPPDGAGGRVNGELLGSYQALLHADFLGWETRHRKLRRLGKGGQGVVFLSQREGSDSFTLPVALKVFSPEHYRDRQGYDEDMARIAQLAGRVALIQHDNILDVHNFLSQNGIRIMEMEWVDGFDLRDLLTERMLDRTKARLSPERWAYVNNVIITAGPVQPRFKPGVAIQVLRECLAGLSALHREGIVHGDLKPSNIMLKRTGNAKVIDMGSAIDLGNPAARRMWSPVYAAPEVMRGGPSTPQSDLVSLGYVLVEMLAGQCPFEGMTSYAELLEAKGRLDQELPRMLPKEVSGNELLLHLCCRLVAADPAKRFPSAEAADLERRGAAEFHRQLVKGDLASEYETDIRQWLERLE